MKDLLARGLNAAEVAGAAYADMRVVRFDTEYLGTKNGRVEDVGRDESVGFGVRVLVNGAWGFACASTLDEDVVADTARRAVRIAEASAIVRREPIRLADETAHEATWAGPCEEDPFGVSITEKVDLLLSINEALRAEKGVTVATAQMTFTREEKSFASTLGSKIDQVLHLSGIEFGAHAMSGSDHQVRHYPAFMFTCRAGGYELVRALPLLQEAPRVAAEAVALLSAPLCPDGERDIIIDGPQMAVQVHESCGHAAELDRVFGTELTLSGGSFLQPEGLGRLRYGSEAVNITADATLPGSAGSYGYDDEGVPGQRWHLVREGIHVGYLTSRETAPAIGAERSTGCMRASGWDHVPLIRMPNINLEPGEASLEELIGGIDDGVFFETNKSFSIDQLRESFQFSTELGWEIKQGKKGRMLKNPVYRGRTVDFWGRCDAVGGAAIWQPWGVRMCGKGQPGQVIHTGHGTAPTRFRRIQVGGAL